MAAQPSLTTGIWMDGGKRVCGVIPGPLPNKSNARRLVLVGPKHQKRPAFIKSKQALSFEEEFRSHAIASLPWDGLPLCGATNQSDIKRGIPFLYLVAKVYAASCSRDLDVELLPDLLQKHGIINNDRAIRRKVYDWALDTDCPRVEFEVGTYSWQ